MSSRVKKKSYTSAHHSLLSNSFTIGLLSDEKICQLLADFIRNCDDIQFEAGFQKLLLINRIKSQFPAFANSIEWISTRSVLFSAESPRLVRIYIGLFKAMRDSLIFFVSLRKEVEKAILFADYEKANILLNQIEEKLGESIWLSRTKMLVLSGLGDREAFDRYCKDCETKSSTSFNTFILKCAQLIADSGNAHLQLGSVVERNVNELKEAKKGILASLLQTLFYPYALEDQIDPFLCLPYIQAFPIVDQYVLIITLLRYEITKGNQTEDHGINASAIALELNAIVPDDQTENLADLKNAIELGPLPSDDFGKRIYATYNAAAYDETVDEFNRNAKKNDHALELVNVAAKAMAYNGNEVTVDNRTSPVLSVASSLATIYSLSPLWSQAETQLLSLCVKYNHLSHGAHIQLALVKALPFRYKRASQMVAAKVAISSTKHCTPQTYALAGATKKSPFDLTKGLEVPLYREIKSEILEELRSGDIDASRIDSRLALLSESGALEKDILECGSTYYLQTGQDRKLLAEAALNITIDSNRFVCYPMEYLLDKIEDENWSDLQAIIVAYHYNNSISDERDYILNEAFEEFLSNSGASKPSELLLAKQELSLEEGIFFRDICVPDVMDYLGCFKNSNQLWAERIIILDILETKKIIDSKSRMREVEDIVRQVIVDAGTSELNGPKIFVNDSAIRKKHQEEVRSLLSLYRKLPEGADERYTKIDSTNAKGGYLSGNRNSLVERLYNLLTTSFLIDDKHGLDKNLSAEIRHGFFSNLMRARLEELHLLTELDENGNYLPNQYWRERNSLVREAYWNEIDEHLQAFSRQFDDTVAQAEEWMKVNLQSDGQERMFTFELSMQEFAQIKEIIEVSEEADYVTSHIIDLLWRKTESALTAVRERLDGEFKGKIETLFSDTIDKIAVTKGELPLHDLMQAFTRARNEIKEDINTASEWFNKNENSEITAGTLDRLIEIAVRSFEKVRGNAYSISLATPAELRYIPVNKQVAKPFILAIINLLDNCYAHSGLGQATRVEVTASLSDFLATVTIKNSLSAEKQHQLSHARLVEIRDKLESSDISRHIRGEGGTGLIKANHEISYLGQKSRLEISRQGPFFYAGITYDYGAAV